MISKKLHSSASYYFIVKLGIHTFNHILLARVLGGNEYQLEDEPTISLNLTGKKPTNEKIKKKQKKFW
jgi:hypothetical protein